MPVWSATTLRSSVGDWSAPRPCTSWVAGASARCCSTAATRVGRPTRARGSSRPRRPNATTRAWVELARAAGEHYDTLIPALTGETGWARCGILQLATRPSDVPSWEWVAERAPGATEITGDDARAMVPVLGDVVRALHHPGAARVDGRLMCAALRRAAVEQHGVEVRAEGVDDVRALPADTVVIAGGAWTGKSRSNSPCGCRSGQCAGRSCISVSPTTPRRGRSSSPCSGTTWSRGPTRGSRSVPPSKTSGSRPMSPRAVCTRCCARHCASCRVSRRSTLREVRVGLRPVSIDDTPVLGAVPGAPGFFVATGHGANGLLLGPVSGALLADLVVGREPALDLAPFSPARFDA